MIDIGAVALDDTSVQPHMNWVILGPEDPAEWYNIILEDPSMSVSEAVILQLFFHSFNTSSFILWT